MPRSFTPSGCLPCACRDCMDPVYGHPGDLCTGCEEAGCAGDGECQSPDAYGGDPEPATGFHAAVAHQGFAIVTEGCVHPATVIARLLAALKLLAPAAHAGLAAPGGAIASIPVAALADEAHAYWSAAGDEVLAALINALQIAAPEGTIFCCEGEWHRLGFFRA